MPYFDIPTRKRPEDLGPLFSSNPPAVKSGGSNSAMDVKSEIYRSLDKNLLSEQQQRVYDAFAKFPIACDGMIARALNMYPSTISARRKELIGMGLMERARQGAEELRILDEATGMHVAAWRVL